MCQLLVSSRQWSRPVLQPVIITDHHRLFIGCDRNYQHCITLHQKTDLLNHQCSAHHVPVKEIIFQFLDCTYLV